MKSSAELVDDLEGQEDTVILSSFSAITHCNDALVKLGNEIAGEFDLHLSEMGVLDTLGLNGPLTMGVLSREALISPSNTTHVVKKLEKLGMVVRKRSDESDRVVTVALTVEGEALHDRTKPRMIGAVRDYFAKRLSTSERQTLNRLMVKLNS
jgi:DNA-binding MarR family transcriptional regulator